jgi:hypothetical protein
MIETNDLEESNSFQMQPNFANMRRGSRFVFDHGAEFVAERDNLDVEGERSFNDVQGQSDMILEPTIKRQNKINGGFDFQDQDDDDDNDPESETELFRPPPIKKGFGFDFED